MTPTLLILAAGIGSRYGSLKQVDPVGPSGETIMDYSIYDAIRSGFGRVVFVIRKDIEKEFREVFGHKFEKIIPVEYVFQELDTIPEGTEVPDGRIKPWGTGHAVLVASGMIREPFAVVNADDFYGHEAYLKISEHLAAPGNAEYAMAGYRLSNTLSEFGYVSRGICRTSASGYLEKVTERTKIRRSGDRIVYMDASESLYTLPEDVYVSMNFWGFTPEVFPQLDRLFRPFMEGNAGNPKAEFYLSSAVDDLIRSGEAKVKVLPTQGRWFGVTYKEDKPMVVNTIQSLIQAGQYPEKLF